MGDSPDREGRAMRGGEGGERDVAWENTKLAHTSPTPSGAGSSYSDCQAHQCPVQCVQGGEQ